MAPLRPFTSRRDRKIPTTERDFPFLCIKFIEIGIFLQHKRLPLRSFAVLWDKLYPKENCEISLVCEFFFRYGKNYEIQICSSTKNFSAHRLKLSSGNCDTLYLIHKSFRYQKISGIQKGSSATFFFTGDRNIPTEKRHITFQSMKFIEIGFFWNTKGSLYEALRFSVGNFLSHCGDKGRRGTLLYFRIFPVSKDFLGYLGRVQQSSVESFSLRLLKTFVEELFCVSELLPYRKFLRIRGRYHFFCRRYFVSKYRKTS